MPLDSRAIAAEIVTLARDTVYEWEIWSTLFYGDISGRVGAYSRSPKVFMYVRWCLLTEVIAGLNRLGDPPKSAGKDTLSVRAWLQVAEAANDVPQRAIQRAYAFLRDLERPGLRDVRNQQLSHNDARVYLGELAKPDPSIEHVRYCVERASMLAGELRAWLAGKAIPIGAPESMGLIEIPPTVKSECQVLIAQLMQAPLPSTEL